MIIFSNSFEGMTRDIRATHMKNQSNFVCHCDACTFDYPILEKIVFLDTTIAYDLEKHLCETDMCLQGFPHSKLLEFKLMCKQYQRLYKKENFPCREFFICERIIRQLFWIITRIHTVWPLLRRTLYDEDP